VGHDVTWGREEVCRWVHTAACAEVSGYIMVVGENSQVAKYMYFYLPASGPTVSPPPGLSKAKTFKLAELWKKANHVKWAQRSAHVFAFPTRNE
jgi:hypothetical protein